MEVDLHGPRSRLVRARALVGGAFLGCAIFDDFLRRLRKVRHAVYRLDVNRAHFRARHWCSIK